MTDIRLHRAHQERMPRIPSFSKNLTQRLKLNGITQSCAGSVSFDVVNFRGTYSRHVQGLTHQSLLCQSVGRCQATAAAILVHCASAYECQNVVFVPNSVGEPLQNDHSAAFPSHVSISPSIESLAPACR